MDRSFPNTVCAALPGAVLEHPFNPGTDTWKVGGKIFALITPAGNGITLKCPDAETAAFLIEIGLAKTAPYLKRGGWVQILWSTLDDGRMEADDLADRLRAAHATIVASLPKRLRP